jgi:hypothetical protein
MSVDEQKPAHGLEYLIADLERQKLNWRLNIIRGWLDGYNESKVKHLKDQFLEPEQAAAMARVNRFF